MHKILYTFSWFPDRKKYFHPIFSPSCHSWVQKLTFQSGNIVTVPYLFLPGLCLMPMINTLKFGKKVVWFINLLATWLVHVCVTCEEN